MTNTTTHAENLTRSVKIMRVVRFCMYIQNPEGPTSEICEVDVFLLILSFGNFLIYVHNFRSLTIDKINRSVFLNVLINSKL